MFSCLILHALTLKLEILRTKYGFQVPSDVQELKLELFDHDVFDPDDRIGVARVPVRDLQNGEKRDMWLDVDLAPSQDDDTQVCAHLIQPHKLCADAGFCWRNLLQLAILTLRSRLVTLQYICVRGTFPRPYLHRGPCPLNNPSLCSHPPQQEGLLLLTSLKQSS